MPALDDGPFIHRIVSAAECEPLQPGLCSVFALPGAPIEILRSMAASLKQHGRTGHDFAFRVERDESVVRGRRMCPEETDEWKAREAARRARQQVPKPTGYKRQRSRKLLALIGADT